MEPRSGRTGARRKETIAWTECFGRPLKRAKKQPPPGRGIHLRANSYSMVRFAARCFHLGEMIDEANAALVANARRYLDLPLDINDRDCFHWHADIVMRPISRIHVT